MAKWLKRFFAGFFSIPFEEMRKGDEALCYRCGRECVCGSVCLYCGFPSPGPSEIYNKGF